MPSLRSLTESEVFWPTATGICDGTYFEVELPRRPAKRKSNKPSVELLSRTIESEVIPRLMLAHSSSNFAHVENAASKGRPSQDEVFEFARLLISHDTSVAESSAAVVRARGMPLETVFIDLFSVAARHLHDLWQADVCDFAEVTIGLSRLQQLLREFASEFEIEERPLATLRSALLMPAPGDQHTFGIFMVQEFFRRAGWNVTTGFPADDEELLDYVAQEPFDVIGLSLSCDRSLPYLRALVNAIRTKSHNRSVRIAVGGQTFLQHPDYVALIGADATATDARLAVPQLSSLLDALAVS